MHPTEPATTPHQIVEPDGTVHTGRFRDPFPRVNLDQAPARTPLASLRGGRLGALERAYRGLRYKRWQYLSVVHPDFLVAAAVVDAGYLATGFAYLVDRTRNTLHQWSRLGPPGRGARVAPSSVDGISDFEAPGFGLIRMQNQSARGLRTLEIALRATAASPPLAVHCSILDSGRSPDPMVVVHPVAADRWLYTHKVFGLPAGGSVRCGRLQAEVPPGQALAGLDYNCGHRLYETTWNWAAAAGHAKDGTPIGFNLTRHRTDQAQDCALWLDGRTVPLSEARFQYDPTHRTTAPWRIRDPDGLCDLGFDPQGERSENIQLGLVVSQFHQPYGRFSGTLRDREGRGFELGDVYGVTEEHRARW
jgi:hypothetical protein